MPDRDATTEADRLCSTCMFGGKVHEIVVRRGIFLAHDFDQPSSTRPDAGATPAGKPTKAPGQAS